MTYCLCNKFFKFIIEILVHIGSKNSLQAIGRILLAKFFQLKFKVKSITELISFEIKTNAAGVGKT